MNYIQKLQQKMAEQGLDEDYINLCSNYAQKLLNNSMPVVFDFSHLSSLLGLESAELAFYLFAEESLFYKEIKIPKKSGGFCKGKSIYNNALLHVNKECVLNMDLKDFFPSIKLKDVFFIFYGNGYTKQVSYYFAKLLTKNGVLPQGSPASPMLSNMVAKHLDERLNKLAKKYHAEYSRYADDITFSGMSNIKKMIPIVMTIIEEEGFNVNEKKTRYAYYYQRQEVTGLIVNKKVSVTKEYIKELKKEIYFCQKFGVVSHLERTNNHKSFYKEHLYGKAYFVNMVDKKIGQEILKQLDTIMWEY